MIFFWLSLVALTFAVLGFLVHAFYFSRKDLLERQNEELERLREKLAVREKAGADAQEEIRKTRTLLQSLERQLLQRNEQISTLQSMAKRQDEEIRLLQKAASESGLNAGEEAKHTDANAARVATSLEEAALLEVQDAKDEKIPLWKDNLNNILSMLDRIEKETKP